MKFVYPDNWEDCKLNDYDACVECLYYDNCAYKDYYKLQNGCLHTLMLIALIGIALFILVVAVFNLMGA